MSALLPPMGASTSLAEKLPVKYSLGKGDTFPTQRRPVWRDLTTAPLDVIRTWIQGSGITIRSQANTAERLEKAQRLVYT